MAIITISKGSFTRGQEVAEAVADRLGYRRVSRRIIIEASEQFNIPEIKLLQVVRDAPSFFDTVSFAKEKYTAYFEAALLEHLRDNDIVYHGLAGHYFVRDISHVLKVRIIGNRADRIRRLREHDALQQQAATALNGMPGAPVRRVRRRRPITRRQAERTLDGIDEARRRWGLHLYGIDTHDAASYDLVVHLDRLSTDEAAEIVCFTARLDRFRATAESQQTLENLLLAARVRARLIERLPRIKVIARSGRVYVGLEGGTQRDRAWINEAIAGVPGMESVEITLYPFTVVD